MTRLVLRAAIALVLLAACGGTEPSSTKDLGAPAGRTSPPTPALPVPAGSPAPAPAPAGDGAAPAASSCNATLKTVNDHSEFDERCSANGRTASRECTLATGDSAWACLCTAASGNSSSCEVPVTAAAAIAPPSNCCPAE